MRARTSFWTKQRRHRLPCARDEARLRRASADLMAKHRDAEVQYYPVDVANQAEVRKTVVKIIERNGRMDWLVNNAGTGEAGRFESQPAEIMRQVMDTNYWGAAYFTLEALPYLRQSSGAAIAFVSSVAGYVGLFGYSHYVPSKFALTGLAECLRMEFDDYHIPVTLIYPPDTRTPLYDREQERTLPECKALSANAMLATPEWVAGKLVDGMMNKQFEVYCNIESRLIRLLRNAAPGLFFSAVDGIVSRHRKSLASARAGS